MDTYAKMKELDARTAEIAVVVAGLSALVAEVVATQGVITEQIGLLAERVNAPLQVVETNLEQHVFFDPETTEAQATQAFEEDARAVAVEPAKKPARQSKAKS